MSSTKEIRSSEEDLFGLGNAASKSAATGAERIINGGRRNPLDSPATSPRPAWSRNREGKANNRSSALPPPFSGGDEKVEGESTATSSIRSSSHQSSNSLRTVIPSFDIAGGHVDPLISSAPATAGGGGRSEGSHTPLLSAPSFILTSGEDDGVEEVAVTDGPLSVAGPAKLKRSASAFEIECNMSAPFPIKMKRGMSNESGDFDDCRGIDVMTAENWSLAKRYGFPCSGNDLVAEEEQNNEHLMDTADKLAEEHWDQALRSGANLLAAASDQVVDQLQRLSRKYGIPSHLRGIIWLTLSGVALKMEENAQFCSVVMKKWGETTGIAAVTIEKDLDRTFPEHPYFAQGQPGINRLKNVLHALCWRNPLLTYCQSFNFLAGTLLLFLDDEEAVFWMMIHILENLLPNDYYGEGLIGLKIDQEVAMHMLGQSCPRLVDHFEDIRFDVRALVPAWLMSLYIGTFPVETTIRIWDYLLTHDPKKFSTVPMAILIAFLKMHQEEFLKIDDAGELHVAMALCAQKQFDGNKLVKTAYELKISSRELQNLRRIARQNILVDIQIQKRKREQFHKMQAKRLADIAERAANGVTDNEDAPRNLELLRSPLSSTLGYSSNDGSFQSSTTAQNAIGRGISRPQYWDEADLQSIEMDDKQLTSYYTATQHSVTVGRGAYPAVANGEENDPEEVGGEANPMPRHGSGTPSPASTTVQSPPSPSPPPSMHDE